MDKKSFLEELKEALEGTIPDFEIESHITYYDEYYEERKRAGATESEISDELGSPRLIAKTLINTSKIANERNTSKSYDYTEDYTEESKNHDKNNIKRKWLEIMIKFFFNKELLTKGDKILAIATIVLAIMLFLVLSYSAMYIMGIVLRILMPIILLLLLVFMWISLFKNK